MILYCFYQKFAGLILILSLLNAYLVQSSSTTNQCVNYCSTDGICLRTENGPKCICSPKWTGERCEIAQQSNISRTNITESRNDPCTYAPDNFCQNGGMCYVDSIKNEFACHCPYPYGGDNCERLSICYNYCFYDGVCTEANNKATCKCSADREGDRCELLITTTTTAGPVTTTTPTTTTTSVQCVYLKCNSGTCVVQNNKAKCVCPPTHTGVQCQTALGGATTQGPATVFPPTSGGPTLFPTTSGGPTLFPTTSGGPTLFPTTSGGPTLFPTTSGGPTLFPTTSGGPTVFPPTATSSTGPPITCANAPCRNGACYNTGNSYFCLCDPRYNGKNCDNPVQ